MTVDTVVIKVSSSSYRDQRKVPSPKSIAVSRPDEQGHSRWTTEQNPMKIVEFNEVGDSDVVFGGLGPKFTRRRCYQQFRQLLIQRKEIYRKHSLSVRNKIIAEIIDLSIKDGMAFFKFRSASNLAEEMTRTELIDKIRKMFSGKEASVFFFRLPPHLLDISIVSLEQLFSGSSMGNAEKTKRPLGDLRSSFAARSVVSQPRSQDPSMIIRNPKPLCLIHSKPNLP